MTWELEHTWLLEERKLWDEYEELEDLEQGLVLLKLEELEAQQELSVDMDENNLEEDDKREELELLSQKQSYSKEEDDEDEEKEDNDDEWDEDDELANSIKKLDEDWFGGVAVVGKLEDELYCCFTLCGQAEDGIEKLLPIGDSQRQSKSDSWEKRLLHVFFS